MYRISKLFNPEIFQEKFKIKNYFEGWYYKIVDKKETNSFAFIPGIAYDKEGNKLVKLNSGNNKSSYTFLIDEIIYMIED